MEVIKRCLAALKTKASRIGWSLASSVVGAMIGVAVGTLWGNTVGWK